MDITPISSQIGNNYRASGGCGLGGCQDVKSGHEQKNGPGQELSEEDRRKLEQLKQTDRGVRAHEAAHMAAAGGHAQGGAHFEYQRGPDGRSYAVGGEVSIDTSAVSGDPEATLSKAQAVQQAALAPTDPSSQDRQVAAEAAAMAAQARLDISRQEDEQNPASESTGGETTNKPGTADALMQRFNAAGALAGRAEPALHLLA